MRPKHETSRAGKIVPPTMIARRCIPYKKLPNLKLLLIKWNKIRKKSLETHHKLMPFACKFYLLFIVTAKECGNVRGMKEKSHKKQWFQMLQTICCRFFLFNLTRKFYIIKTFFFDQVWEANMQRKPRSKQKKL